MAEELVVEETAVETQACTEPTVVVALVKEVDSVESDCMRGGSGPC